MLVFRCECEQVLGVESEASKGGLGECPSCGRIIRVPMSLVNAAGKLRMTPPPQRASGAYRLIKDVKPEPKNGAGSGLTAAVSAPPPAPPAVPREPVHTPPEPTVLAEDLEPETLAPLTESSLNRPITDSSTVESIDEAQPAEVTAEPEQKPAPSSASGRKDSLSKKPTKSPQAVPPESVGDAAAASETRIDRNSGTTVTAHPRRRKTDAASGEVEKKSSMTVYLLVAAIALVVVAALYFMGVFSRTPEKSNSDAPATTARPTDTKAESKPDSTEKKADEPTEPVKKDDK